MNELRTILDNHPNFRPEDFSLAEGWVATTSTVRDAPRQETVLIEYLYASGFTFKITVKEGHGSATTFAFSASPGDVSQVQHGSADGRQRLESQITNWLNRVDEELILVPVNRQLDEQRARVDTLAEQIASLPDEYYTREEAEQLRTQLDELRAKFNDHLSNTHESQETIGAAMASFDEDIAYLKANLTRLKKPGWARAFFTRLARAANDPENKVLLDAGMQVSQFLLTEGAKHLPK